jgi:hypothetical protein
MVARSIPLIVPILREVEGPNKIVRSNHNALSDVVWSNQKCLGREVHLIIRFAKATEISHDYLSKQPCYTLTEGLCCDRY